MKISISVFLFLIICIIAGCSKDEPKEDPEVRLRGSWSPYWSFLYHDGEPVESENFIVFSDKSSTEWRETVAELAEEAFIEIKAHLNVEDSDFDFVSSQSNRKIHILTNYNQWNIAVAYRDGVVIRSKDGPNFYGDHLTWEKVFKHEITHVFEFLLIGDFNRRQSNTVWMREGFGNYGAKNYRIQSIEEITEWRTKMKDVEGMGNPIGIRAWGDFPQSVVDAGTTGEYYGFFELAVRYLVDEQNGNGTNIENLKTYLDDLGAGVNQRTAFQQHFGVEIDEFQTNFWALMEEYLE